MFRIYSGIDQSAHLQRVQVWFEITDRFVSKLAEIAYFCKITSTSSCLVYWREEYYLCWSSRSVWINEGSSDVWIQWWSVHISISCTVELVSVYLLFWCYASSVNTCLEVEQYSVVIWSSLLQVFWRRFLAPVSGACVMGISAAWS